MIAWGQPPSAASRAQLDFILPLFRNKEWLWIAQRFSAAKKII